MRPEYFKNWLMKSENKKPSTSSQYATAITNISQHYSQQIGKKVDLYLIDDLDNLKMLVDLYGTKGKYSEFGNIGHGTNRAAIKALYRYRIDKRGDNYSTFKNDYLSKVNNDNSHLKKDKLTDQKGTYIEKGLPQSTLENEAQMMSKHYEIFYILERSIRELIVKTMREKFGENWWDSGVNYDIRESVESKIKIETRSILTKQSDRKIDYTTFGQLRKIITSNWEIFSKYFNKDKSTFIRIMIDLNKLRNPIAHCTPFIDKEVIRLNLTVDDWYELLKKV